MQKIKNIFFVRILFALLLLTFAQRGFASNYYWVGGGGNWNDCTTHWATTSGGNTFYSQMPTAADDVFFDSNSFPFAAPTLNIPYVDPVCHNMTWSGVTNVPSITGGAPSGFMEIYGSMTLVAGINWNFSGELAFVSPTAGQTISTAGVMIASVDFNGAGSWTLQDSLLSTTIKVLDGNLYSNNQHITTEQFSMVGTTSFAHLGTSTITMNGTMQWTGAVVAQLDADSATINFVIQWMALFDGAGGKYGTVNFLNQCSATVNGGATFGKMYSDGDMVLNGDNTFDTLLFYNLGYTIHLESNHTQTINDTMELQGNCQQQMYLSSSISGQQATIRKTSGNVLVDFATLQDINATGGATFSATHVAGAYNVSGWNIVYIGPRSLYWVGGTGNWNTEMHWSLSSGGVGGVCVPTSIDDVFFDGNSGLGNGDSVFTTSASPIYCKSMDWTGTVGNPIFRISPAVLNVLGSLKLVSNMSIHGGLVVQFYSPLAGNTITTAGQRINYLLFYGTGDWTLMDSVSCSQILISAGTLYTANHPAYCSNPGSFIVNNNASAILGTSVITTEGWTATTLANVSATSSVINIIGYASGFTGGGHSYNVVNASSYTLGFSNNGFVHKAILSPTLAMSFSTDETFDTLIVNFPDGDFSLQQNTTVTVNNALLGGGTSGHLMLLHSSQNGQPANFFMSVGDTTCIDYVTMHDNHATGGGVFYAGANSVNVSNNNGWNFLACGTPLGVNENSTETQIEIFPNPTSGRFTFNTGNEKFVEVKVIDALGETVDAKMVSANSNMELDLSNFPNGIYFVQIVLENGNRVTKKVVKD